MQLSIVTTKSTGVKWWVGHRRIFGRTEYTADISGDVKPVWTRTLGAARRLGEDRGTIQLVGEIRVVAS